MRAVVLLLLAALLAGCASQAPSIERTGVPAGEAAVPVPAPRGEAPPALAVVPAADPRAPPVTLGGAPAHAAVILARERVAEGWRELCGGAVLAVPEGAPDPRDRVGALQYVESYRLIDDAGRAWVTDRYQDAEGDVWAARVGGGETFAADDGESRCEPAGPEHNVLLHARGVDTLAIALVPDVAPATPEARAWWTP